MNVCSGKLIRGVWKGGADVGSFPRALAALLTHAV